MRPSLGLRGVSKGGLASVWRSDASSKVEGAASQHRITFGRSTRVGMGSAGCRSGAALLPEVLSATEARHGRRSDVGTQPLPRHRFAWRSGRHLKKTAPPANVMHREAGIPSPGTRRDGVGVTDRALQPCAIDHAEPATLLRQKVSHDPPGRFVRKARGYVSRGACRRSCFAGRAERQQDLPLTT